MTDENKLNITDDELIDKVFRRFPMEGNASDFKILGQPENTTQGVNSKIVLEQIPINEQVKQVEPDVEIDDTMTPNNTEDEVSKRVRWLEKELQQLIQMYFAGASLKDIALFLGRTEESIKQKIKYLGLKRPEPQKEEVEDFAEVYQDIEEHYDDLDDNDICLPTVFRGLMKRGWIINEKLWALLQQGKISHKTYMRHWCFMMQIASKHKLMQTLF